MAATVQSLTALLQRSKVEDDEEVIKACNAILKKSKHDLETQYVKVVALLKCDRFEDAIRLIEDGGDALKSRASLEWSYALYKTGKLDEAIGAAVAAASAGRGRGAKHVEAQASYRAENFRRTSQIYDDLCKQKETYEQEQIDLRINMRATDAQLLWSRQDSGRDIKRPTREDLEGFETAYNAACEYIARGQLHQAQLLLKRAKDLCGSSEDLTPEDKEAELVPISVQQLYVALQQGKLDEAAALVEQINVDSIPELSTKRVAQNNTLIAAHQKSNPYLQHKIFHSTTEPTGSDKLFSFQSRTFDWNSYAIDLLVHKYDGIARSTSKILSQHGAATISPDVNNISVVNVAAHCRDETGKICLKKALPLLEKRPNDLGLVLAIVQLYVESSNISSAISVLESFMARLEESISESDLDVRYNPGLISVLVSLYKSQGRKRGIKAELSKAATHWQQRPDQAGSLLGVAGSSLLRSSDPADLAKAGEIFSKLHKIDPSDPVAAAGYVSAYATLEPSTEIRSEAAKLTSVPDLVSGIDVTSLEEAGVPTSAPTTTPGLGASRKRRTAPGDEDKQSSRKKRIRKSRLPKDYDPNKQPDPERWLPLRDRSTYRPPKGKKGKPKPAERTQGGVVDDSGVETGGTQAPVMAQQKSQGGGGRSKKQKGKGKR